ncbi:SufE family protein [Glutamicibacter arilaitensis]|uniref:Cysteine desulfuration protein SufE n=2 Tax=Glutamicibacter arilaitensis TaxID=256701 RepID=A0A2N7S3B7_9MICC|nr:MULTISPECIES: SufE family protein [Glutamicibacter]PMQ20648.1 cysteine desulfuration protein SufE [Glutamicibacter arilaitensis]CBT76194.1 SufE-like protein [Glutamicibacter arilaitensis Re117]HCH48009.1 SufE family protein [Glutamicibacter sp.]HCJ54820.1 SufE family protein [Glutamicibacter sp.]HCM94346.1 SufE family protein [Glutamicibacter sp.]
MSHVPNELNEIVEEFIEVPEADRLELLLEYSRELPELPARLADHPELFEQVVECQSPLFLVVEVGAEANHTVNLFFSAPPEAPTTRGFASVLAAGLDGADAASILAVPDDMPQQLGLTRALSPLRMRGMTAMLGRIKRQISEQLAA